MRPLPGKMPHPAHVDLEGVDPLSTQVFRTYMRTLHLHRQATMKSLAEKGRSFSHVGCLRILAKNDGMSQRDLAETLHLSRPSVTAMLHSLEEEGAVVRRADERDRRLTRVYLTDEGRALEMQMRAGIADYINLTFGSLSADERQELDQLLSRLADSIEASMAEPTTEVDDTTMGTAE